MNLFRHLQRLAAPALTVLMTSLPAAAAPGTDYTDLWYFPAESGWGVNLVQQADVVFATLFVYGADNTARWYVASDLRGSTNFFSGTLYLASGPAFSAAWTGGATPVSVGTMTLAFSGPHIGTLTYTVNGLPVTKPIQRQTFRSRDLSGNYLGGLAALGSGCTGGPTSTQVLTTGYIRVAQSGTEVTFVIDYMRGDVQGRCTYAGDFTPSGRLGTVTGVHTCRSGTTASSGPFTMTEVDAGKTVFGAVYSASDETCGSYAGFFGGVRDIQLPSQ